VSPEASEHRPRASRSDVRMVARKALLRLFEPLVGFVLDSGLSTHELHTILREAAVRSVAAKQLEVARRVNISGIAASTGIPRAEISRMLKTPSNYSRQATDRQHQSTNRILAVWHQDPKFTAPNGKPADLKIYGRGASFESLVKNYGRGIPTRAMLDELTRAGAAEVLPSGLIRVRASVALDRGVTPRGITSFGERATELLSTMLKNMRHPENPHFVAGISSTKFSPSTVPLFRKELSSKGADFLAELHDSLSRTPAGPNAKKNSSRTGRISVTIFYHEVPPKAKVAKNVMHKRRNFRRESG
jgi:DNA-binding phage protein